MSTKKRRLILDKAMQVFQKHGYRRVNMKEIAESLNISRPGLYLHFKTKEEIFRAVIREFGNQAIDRAMNDASARVTLDEKLKVAFEVYVVRIFSMTLSSPEAKEIADSSFEFAREAVDESYQKFEDLIVSILLAHRSEITMNVDISLKQCARILVSASRGFKIVARNAGELRKMIHQLQQLTLGR